MEHKILFLGAVLGVTVVFCTIAWPLFAVLAGALAIPLHFFGLMHMGVEPLLAAFLLIASAFAVAARYRAWGWRLCC